MVDDTGFTQSQLDQGRFVIGEYTTDEGSYYEYSHPVSVLLCLLDAARAD